MYSNLYLAYTSVFKESETPKYHKYLIKSLPAPWSKYLYSSNSVEGGALVKNSPPTLPAYSRQHMKVVLHPLSTTNINIANS